MPLVLFLWGNLTNTRTLRPLAENGRPEDSLRHSASNEHQLGVELRQAPGKSVGPHGVGLCPCHGFGQMCGPEGTMDLGGEVGKLAPVFLLVRAVP